MPRWKSHERAVAAVLGGQRLPNNGRPQADVRATVNGHQLAVQVKTRAVPAWLLAAVAQAERDADTDELPVVVLCAASQGVRARRLAIVDIGHLPSVLSDLVDTERPTRARGGRPREPH